MIQTPGILKKISAKQPVAFYFGLLWLSIIGYFGLAVGAIRSNK
jgi:hypothetical protein